jgi:HlyD family secretion protein
MDIPIQKKTWTLSRILLLAGAVLVVGLLTASFLSTAGPSKLNVDPERITISEVTRGPFQEFIPVDGVVMPIRTAKPPCST